MTVATVDLGAVTFYGSDQHSSGVFHFATLSDWYTLTESKSEVVERPVNHGSFGIAYDFRRSSAHTLEGWAYGASWAEVLGMMDTLNAALGTNVPTSMTLTDDAGSSTRMVSVRSVKLNEDKEFNWLTFSIDVVAANPYRLTGGS